MANFNNHSHASTEHLYQMNTLAQPQRDSNPEYHDERTDVHPQSEERLLQSDETKTRVMLTKKVETSVIRLVLAWLPEILASVFSVGILFALSMVLGHYNGSALNEIDLPNGLTLNSFASILSTLARICVMVPIASVLSQEAWLWFSNPKQPRRLRDLARSEAATRGVLGSLTFLLTSPRRITASLAALVTLLSLGFGTFTQQLIANAYIDVTDPALLPGELPRGETYVYHEGDALEPAPEIPQAPVPWRAAVYNGMMADISQVEANCPTGNCTWPVTTSLAVCGACSPSEFTKSKSCDIHAYRGKGCNYTLPDGSVSSFTYDSTTDAYTGFELVPSSTGHIYNASLMDKAYITNFFSIGYSIFSDLTNPTNFSAHECALWWCVNGYDVSSRASVQTTTIVYTQDTLNASGYQPEGYNGSPGNEIMFHNLTFPPLPAEIQTRLNLSAAAASIEFSVMTISLVSLRAYMKSILKGTGTMESHATAASSDIVEAVWTAASGGSSAGAAAATMADWIARVALSLSNYVREPSASAFVAVGSQARPAEFAGRATILGVVVRWRWLVLPAGMVAVAIALLVAIVVQSAGSSVGVWKGSWLMYLFCELSPDIRNLVQGRRLGVGRLGWTASGGKEHQRGNMSVVDFVGDAPVRLTQGENGGWTFEGLRG